MLSCLNNVATVFRAKHQMEITVRGLELGEIGAEICSVVDYLDHSVMERFIGSANPIEKIFYKFQVPSDESWKFYYSRFFDRDQK